MNGSGEWTSIGTMLEHNAARFATRPALSDDDGVQLTHEALYAQVSAVVTALRELGIESKNHVAIVLPRGTDMAVAFLAVAAASASAPLNPDYLEDEFVFQLRDLSAKALIVAQGAKSASRAAAATLGIPVLELRPLAEGGGFVDRPVGWSSTATPPDFAPANGVALTLHTSGTTSRPKRVPLTHANLCASARNIVAALQLGVDDISLSAMPLFHIHGLACVLAALSAGGSCVCVRSFQADQFPRWLDRWKPTWFSAVPTMHQALLDFARHESFAGSSLKFIRSSSAPLPPPVMAGLEKIFGVPVVESYGMTEAAHQMASNPLPPLPRKAGSVGLPAGPNIAILNKEGGKLDRGKTGEVAIQGPNVMQGYEGNAEANASAFSADWFLTGDQGYFDADGYLFITGRLKELINRGGEKVAPREIDDVLLTHSAVRQTVAFAVPHPSLGEDVASAVVIRPGASCTEAELRAYLLDRLPAFMVPSQIVFVDEVPKGPTGKVQRIGMAHRLEKFLRVAYQAPASDMENLVARTVGDILHREKVGREDNFFALGGDSLRATQVLTRLRQTLQLELPVPMLFRFPTPALLGARLEELAAAREIDQLAKELATLSPGEQARLMDEVRGFGAGET